MTSVVVAMAVIVGVAVLALAYAAFPHRREPVPGARWLGRLVERVSDAVPVIEDGDLEPAEREYVRT